jgi:hypothetical protein
MHFRTLIDFEKCQLINAGTLKGTYPGVCIIDAELGTLESFDFQSDQGLVKAQDFSLNCRKTRRIWRNTKEFDCNWEPVTLHRRAVATTARA